MFIETSSPRRPNDTARLISQTVTPTSGACLRFWYHMYGTHINTLNVYTKSGGQLGTPVWSHTGKKWKRDSSQHKIGVGLGRGEGGNRNKKEMQALSSRGTKRKLINIFLFLWNKKMLVFKFYNFTLQEVFYDLSAYMYCNKNQPQTCFTLLKICIGR